MILAGFSRLSCIAKYYHQKMKGERYLKYTQKYIPLRNQKTMPGKQTNDMTPNFNKNLRKYWGQTDLTLEQLADKAYLSIATLKILLYKGNTDPRISTVVNLANALDCTVNDLIGYRKDRRYEESGRILAEIKEMLDKHFFDKSTHVVKFSIVPNFPRNLRKFWGQSGLSLEQIAERSFLSVTTLKGFLYRGEDDPKLSTVINLAVVLDCTVNDLIGYTRRKNPHENENLLLEINELLDKYYEGI